MPWSASCCRGGRPLGLPPAAFLPGAARAAALGLLLAGLLFGPRAPADEPVFVREEFESLESWDELAFQWMPRHSSYGTASVDGRSVLSMSSHQAASGLILKRRFNVAEFPVLEWAWKISDVLAAGNASRRDGDDVPARVFVLFEYDRTQIGPFERLRYRALRLFHGEYPPLASLNYIWANRSEEQGVIPSPYTSRSMMIIADAGADHAGEWRTHRVDVLEDYRRVFGREPPPRAGIVVMTDSDDTGGSTQAWLDYIEIRKRP